jgi:hypothetical protein
MYSVINGVDKKSLESKSFWSESLANKLFVASYPVKTE